ncbi:MAG: NADH-quinone oxidoreductase subunit I [Microthrixaceae bacterium]|nr:NADH-quinone oxidoreductase subunit I [Microthrixaceae bacterium]MCB1010235.1 NADH-quinone oxidoreductase subunit I [Microthrixaceae bacterium]MCO5320755.1 NADH-quinone oxidoreductase subunit I [Microthrixaceae bacterium]
MANSPLKVTKGLFAGLGVTMRTALRTMFPKRGAKTLIPAPSKGAHTVQYPHEVDVPAPRARGVIALHTENCTACMLCARECPDWCIYIEGHKTLAPPRREGGKPRSVNELDRFDIDYSLCMYCGICVEVCPFEALFWSPEFEYSELKIADLIHDKGRLSMWMETVPPFESYEAGSEAKVLKVPDPVPRDKR